MNFVNSWPALVCFFIFGFLNTVCGWRNRHPVNLLLGGILLGCLLINVVDMVFNKIHFGVLGVLK